MIKKAEDDAQNRRRARKGKKRQTSSGQQPGRCPAAHPASRRAGASPAQSSHNNPAPQVDSTLAEIQRTRRRLGNLPRPSRRR